MNTPIYSIIESVTNPEGRFKSLEGIFALRDAKGELQMNVTTYMANIMTEWRMKRYILKCFISDAREIKEAAKRISEYCEVMACDFISGFRYLQEEMLIFDQFGNGTYHDVILQDYPDGINIENMLFELCKNGGGDSERNFSELFSSVRRLSEWMDKHDFVHRNIKPTNIIVTSSMTPVLMNYENARVKSGDKAALDADSYALAVTALTVYLAACEPKLYKTIKRYYGSVFKNFRRILPELCQAAYETGNETLMLLTLEMLKGRGKLGDRLVLNSALRSLEEHGVGHSKLPLILTDIVNEASSFDIDTIEKLSHYEEYGKLSDGLRRVFTGEKWFYVDRFGVRAIESAFESAEDFSSGLAVVGSNGYYGLINEKGEYILSSVFDDIRWYALEGVAIVEFEGIMSIYNKHGQKITERNYDWLGDIEEGVIAAGEDGKYGYIYPDGTLALPFIYDNAFDFRNGKAITESGGVEYFIDSNGNTLGNVDAPHFLNYK